MKTQKIIDGRRLWVLFILLSLLIGLLTGLLSGCLEIKQSIRADAPLEDFQAHMRERIPALMLQYRVPGCCIAIIKDSEILWTGAYGYADMARGRRLTAETPMSVQSITKSVTAWGIMKLVENGVIDLDAPLSNYLTSWDFPQPRWVEGVTVRRLLNHTAGMPLGDFTDAYAPGVKMPSLREKLTQEAILANEPGKVFSYSNVGYNLLELLIEEVTGQDFAEFIGSAVLTPLGMKTATFDVKKSLTPYPPTGYDLKGRPVPVYVYPEKASGGLFATVEDIGRFAAASMTNNPVLRTENVSRMYETEIGKIGIYGLVFDAYGLGHYIETLPNGLGSVSHGGQGNGIMTHFQIVPKTGDAIVLLTNSQRSWPLIAHVLSDWAKWRGFQSVGMGVITWGQYGLCVIIGMLASASLLMVLRQFWGVRQWAGYRAIKVGAAVILLGAVIYCACQKYSFLPSVFPILSIWLAGAIMLFSAILLVQALLPHNREGK